MESREDQELSTRKFQYPLDPKSYKILDQIGDSSNTIVYRAICLSTNSIVVIKSIFDLPQSSASICDSISRETNTPNSILSHPNLLSFHCFFPADNHIWIIMPFMPAGCLKSIITSNSLPNGLSELYIAIVLKQALSALAYLHTLGKTHRDIKPSNILLDYCGSVTLADYGVSSSIYKSNIPASHASSSTSLSIPTDVSSVPYWVAPEILSNDVNEYTSEADIWAFGITALEVAHGRPPISHLPPSKSLLLKITRRFPFWNRERNKNSFSWDFKNMISLCLEQDPSKRPSAETLLDHSFFKNCDVGLDFLADDVLSNLNMVEQRFKESRRRFPLMKHALVSNKEDDVRRINIRGWKYNEGGFQLDPVLGPIEAHDNIVLKKVSFGDESIIPDPVGRGGEDEAQSSEATRGECVVERIDVDHVINGLKAVLRNMEAEGEQLMNVISLLGSEEGTNENLNVESENENEELSEGSN